MGLLFGKYNVALSNKEIEDRTFGFNNTITIALQNKKKLSKSNVKDIIQQGFIDLFNQVLGDEESFEGIYTYSKLETAAIEHLNNTCSELLKKNKIDLYEFALEPKMDETKNTDSSKSYINKGFAKHIANWPNDRFEELVNTIKNQAKNISERNPDMDLTDYRNQIKALKDAKKERSFGRRIKEFFNGTWLKQKKMFDEIDKKMKENFLSDIHNERAERERINQEEKNKEQLNKETKLENEKKQIVVNELDESKIDYDELTDEQFDAIERQIEQEKQMGK